MAAEYTITHDKGTTFKFHALYKSATGGAIDLDWTDCTNAGSS